MRGGSDAEAFFEKAAAHDLKPSIINAKSSFVVITYWWGRGNLNKNTQRPCPEDVIPGRALEVEPITYEKMIANWADACEKRGCNYLVEEYPEFAIKGGYQHAINFKPHFIELALKACFPRGVLYIDGDMKVRVYPAVCDTKGVDYMARGWNTDSRPALGKKKPTFCFDPYVFEMSGGTMFFGNTQHGRELLKFWQSETKKHPGKADDRILSMAMSKYSLLTPLTTIQLPIEFLWLDLDYDNFLKKKADYNESDIAISHPECLTSEDRAAEEGAAMDRYPQNYDSYTSDFLYCDWETIYEYIHFDKKSDIGPFRQYFDWLEAKGVVDVVPFAKKYGKYNDTAKKNVERMNDINILVREDVVLVSPHDIESTSAHIVAEPRDIVPTILKYLENGQHVVFVPKSTRSVRPVIAKAVAEALDFVTRNKNVSKYRGGRDAYTLKLDEEYPIYFGPHSETLKHWLRMSESIAATEAIFNHTYLFLTRIHCGWI